MTAFDGARQHEDPGLDARRLALGAAVTSPRRRRWPRLCRLWSWYGPLLPLAFGAGMLAGTAIVVLAP